MAREYSRTTECGGEGRHSMRGRRVIPRPHLDPAADAGTFDPISSVRGDGALPREIPHRGRTARNCWSDSGYERRRRQTWNPGTTLEAKIKRLEINKHQFKQLTGYVR